SPALDTERLGLQLGRFVRDRLPRRRRRRRVGALVDQRARDRQCATRLLRRLVVGADTLEGADDLVLVIGDLRFQLGDPVALLRQLHVAVDQLDAGGVEVRLLARQPPVGLLDLLHARRQLALGARRAAQRLVVLGAVLLRQFSLLGEAPAFDVGYARVVLLVARLQLAAP